MPPESTSETVAPDVQPHTILGSAQFDLQSKVNGHTYRLFLHTPLTPPPPEGYPVLYVTDGNGTFPIAAGQAILNALAGNGVMVVGIGYPTEEFGQSLILRTRDLTPSRPVGGRLGGDEFKAQAFGGAEAFYRFITEELQPTIAAQHKVDPANQTLYGHSLGGLFTLHVLFHHPNAFRSFVASSPSIWWNERELLNHEPTFRQAVEAGETAPRVLIEVGGLEESVPKRPVPGRTTAELEAMAADARMIGNARDLFDRLSNLRGGAGFEARFQVFEEEDHMTVMAASLARALTFASGL